MLNYSAFYVKYANRTSDKIKNPRVFNYGRFAFPKATMHHYLPIDDEIGPEPDNSLYSEVKGKIPLYTPLGKLEDMKDLIGRPVFKTVNTLALIKEYHKTNTRYRFFKDVKSIPFKQNMPLVINHSLEAAKLKYNGDVNRKTFYSARNNLLMTLQEANKVNSSSPTQYHNFLIANVPSKPMPVSMMRLAATFMQPAHFQMLGSLDSVVIFELWKWFGVNKSKSLFETLDEKLLPRFNIVFIYNDVWSVLNLGDIAKWRKGEENPNGDVNPKLFGKYFMFFLIKLIKASKNKALVELTEEEVAEQKNVKVDDIQKDEEDDNEGAESTSRNNSTDVDFDDNLHSDETDGDLEDAFFSELIDDDEEDIIDEKPSNISGKLSGKNSAVEQEPEFLIEDSKVQAEDALGLKTVKASSRQSMVVIKDKPDTPEEKGRKALVKYAERNNMPLTRFKTLEKQLNKYNEETLYKGENAKTLAQLADVKPEDFTFTPVEKDGPSVLNAFDERYLEELAERDMVAMFVSAAAGGMFVQKMTKEENNTMGGEYTSYSVRIQPINGQPSTIRARIPKPDANGAFRDKGKTYRLRKQWVDLPIRKISPTEVALSSYYGKTFVSLEGTSKYNYEKWLCNSLRVAAFDPENTFVEKTYTQDVFNHEVKMPNVFQILASSFRAIQLKGIVLLFDLNKINDTLGDDIVAKFNGIKQPNIKLYLCGKQGKDKPVMVNENDEFFVLDNGKLESLGDIEFMANLDLAKRPQSQFTNVDIMSYPVPTGLVLGYHYGLKQLLTNLAPSYYRTVTAGSHLKLEPHEYAIRFKDYALVLSTRDKLCSMVMGGFLKLKDVTSEFSIFQFDSPEVYELCLEALKLKGRYIKEIQLYIDMFVDPITERVLVDMKEPTDFLGLLVRANEMLLTKDHPKKTDRRYQRLRGFERHPGEVWRQLVASKRVHNRHGSPEDYPVEMNPEAVWEKVIRDTTVIIENKLNPIQDLKQQEVTTYGGNGGRSSRSLTKESREYDSSSVGVMSAMSVDSGEAGVTVYTSANPKLTNMYGVVEASPADKGNEGKETELKPENLYSTSELLSVACDTDDSKRKLFIGVQWEHTIPCSNYAVMPTRTDYDTKLAQRCSDTFASMARKDGKVESIDENGIVILNDDGSKRYVQLGRQYGSSGGLNIPHDIVSNLKVGQRVLKGEAIAYNQSFFGIDPDNKANLVYKPGILVKTALQEHRFTYEDSTAISRKLSKSTKTRTTKFIEQEVDFDQVIHKIVKVGQEVNVDDILCFVEEAVTAEGGLFDDESIDILSNISSQSPRSKVKGRVDKIEVFYNGDKEDMSDSLRKLANASDNQLVKSLKAQGKRPYTGMDDGSLRFNGDPMGADKAMIIFSISTDLDIINGDKH